MSIFLPWFPSGDPFSPSQISLYHRYLGEYYQTYDAYFTSLGKLGKLLSLVTGVSGVSYNLKDSILLREAFCPYPIPGSTNWLIKQYEYLKEWSVFHPEILEIFFLGELHRDNPGGYFTPEGIWVWGTRPLDMPLWQGIELPIRSFQATYPIKLNPDTKIYYLSGDSWVFETPDKDGFWSPKYEVQNNSVKLINGSLQDDNHRVLSFDSWAFLGIDEIPELTIPIQESMRNIKYNSGRLYTKVSTPVTPTKVRVTCGGIPHSAYYYPLVDEMFCNGRFSQSELARVAEFAFNLGITPLEYILAIEEEIEYFEIVNTRFTWIYDREAERISFSSRNNSSVPGFSFLFAANRNTSFPPRTSRWLSTDSPTSIEYRISTIINNINNRIGPFGYLPDSRIENDILEGRLVRAFGNIPDEYSFVLLGDFVDPPAAPKRILGFNIPGEVQIAERIFIGNDTLTEEDILVTDENDEDNKIDLDPDDPYFIRYYHGISYANNNVWGFNSSDRPDFIGKLPGFYRRLGTDSSINIHDIVLAPDLGDTSILTEWGKDLRDNAVTRGTIDRSVIPITTTFGNFYSSTLCSSYLRSNCGSSTVTTQIIRTTIDNRVSYDMEEILRFYEEKDPSRLLYKINNPQLIIDLYWLKPIFFVDDIPALENYTMPDSIRVKEMHLAIKELADCFSAKEMAYKFVDGVVPDELDKREKRATNLTWHLLQLCRWNGIYASPEDINVLHIDSRDSLPITIVPSEGSGSGTIEGVYPFGGLGFSTQTGEEGKIEEPENFIPAGIPQMAYKLKSSSFRSDDFGKKSIKQGDYVICHTIQQLIQVLMQDLDKSLGLRELSAAVIPSADQSKKVCTYEGLGSAIAELLYLGSSISNNTSQTHVSSLITQGIVLELMKATGFPLIPKTVEADVGSGENVGIPYPGIADGSPTHFLMFVSLMQTLQPIVASVLAKVNDDSNNGVFNNNLD